MIEMEKMCIVAVGYNRADSMQRLLESLSTADYDGERVDLYISIDKGKNQDLVAEVAKNFVWIYGDKFIRIFSERQGLRSHIIQCGDLTENYKAIVVLEDDVTVSECFYQYAKQAVNFYQYNEKIAGISLYKHVINVGADHMFEPEYNGYDVFFMQYAQSWGQCWTKKMWIEFKKWYVENSENIFENSENLFLKQIPDNVLNWDSHSWLKYYIAYIVEKNLYFVYPYHSLSTNHSELGQHNAFDSSSDYEVALMTGKKSFYFPEFEDSVKYDVFFERVSYTVKGYSKKNVILDLYGKKKEFEKGDILISSQCLPFKILEKWAMKYRPQEINCKKPQKGKAFYVYDLKIKEKSPKKNFAYMRTRYDVRSITWKNLMYLGMLELKDIFIRKFKNRK